MALGDIAEVSERVSSKSSGVGLEPKASRVDHEARSSPGSSPHPCRSAEVRVRPASAVALLVTSGHRGTPLTGPGVVATRTRPATCSAIRTGWSKVAVSETMPPIEWPTRTASAIARSSRTSRVSWARRPKVYPSRSGDRWAVAPLVDGDDPVAVGQRGELSDPDGARQRHPVDQDDRRPGTELHGVDHAAVTGGHLVVDEIVDHPQAGGGQRLVGRPPAARPVPLGDEGSAGGQSCRGPRPRRPPGGRVAGGRGSCGDARHPGAAHVAMRGTRGPMAHSTS